MSTISVAMPVARIRRMVFQISSRTMGARPSVASSRMSRRGLVTSARPMASICCSPPESWSPRLASRWPRRGNSSSTRPRVHSLRAVGSWPLGDGEVLAPRSGWRRCRGPPARRRCRAGRWRAPAHASRPRRRSARRRCAARTRPISVRISVVLPMPLRPIRPMVSPARMAMRDAAQDMALAVVGVEALPCQDRWRWRAGRHQACPPR